MVSCCPLQVNIELLSILFVLQNSQTHFSKRIIRPSLLLIILWLGQWFWLLPCFANRILLSFFSCHKVKLCLDFSLQHWNVNGEQFLTLSVVFYGWVCMYRELSWLAERPPASSSLLLEDGDSVCHFCQHVGLTWLCCFCSTGKSM